MDKDYEYKVLLIDWFEGKQAQCKPQTLEKLLNTGWEIVNVSGSNTRYQAIIRKLSNPTPEEDDSDIDKELKDHGFPDMGWLDQGIKDYVAAKDKEIADLKEKLEKVEQWAKTEEPVSQHDKEDVLFTLGFNNAKIVLLSQILKSK